MSLIKSSQELIILRQAGRKLAEVIELAKTLAKEGVVLSQLDSEIQRAIVQLDATPSFLGYEGYPKASCLSLNQQVVHGIPDDRTLCNGDLLGIDIGLWFKGLCVDGAVTVAIGMPTAEVERLITTTQKALDAGIKAAKPFRKIGAISHAVQAIAEAEHLGIVRALTGHGVGHQVHEPPEVPNIGRPSDGSSLRPGMVLAIEPMLTLGNGEVLTEIDGWGIVTADGSWAAHFEHTVAITSRGVEILTRI